MGEVIVFPTARGPRAAETVGTAPRVQQAPGRRRNDGAPRPLLWREAVGHELRGERLAQQRHQRDVAERAGISTQYLSEIERGRKEPSSEILEAVSGALQLPLVDLVQRAAELLPPSQSSGPVLLAA